MRQIPSAVCVVSAGTDGQRTGLTVTAVCSVSVEPPQVLVAVNKAGRTHACIERTGAFGVNYLASEHQSVAVDFSTAAENVEDKFLNSKWGKSPSGVPLLQEALVSFTCEVAQSVDCGTHTIYVGRVVEFERDSKQALMYRDGEFLSV